jgi:nuclear transport factor 2 (NTF2) superfamily protein
MVDETASGRVTILDQRSLIKIETLHGRTNTQIYELLREVRAVTQHRIAAKFTLVPKVSSISEEY